MKRMQNVCEKKQQTILMRLIPISVGVVVSLSAPRLRLGDLAPINEVKEFLIRKRLDIVHRYQYCG